MGFSNVLAWLKDFKTALNNSLNNITSTISNSFSDFKTNMSEWWTSLQYWINNLGSVIGDRFNNFMAIFNEWFQNLERWWQDLVVSFGEWFASVGQWFAELPQKLVESFKDLFELLFVPEEDHFGELKDKINSKFPIIEQVTELSKSLLGFSYDKEPVFNVTYKGVTYNIFDLSSFSAYRTVINGIILALCYFVFIRRLLRRIPTLIGGF